MINLPTMDRKCLPLNADCIFDDNLRVKESCRKVLTVAISLCASQVAAACRVDQDGTSRVVVIWWDFITGCSSCIDIVGSWSFKDGIKMLFIDDSHLLMCYRSRTSASCNSGNKVDHLAMILIVKDVIKTVFMPHHQHVAPFASNFLLDFTLLSKSVHSNGKMQCAHVCVTTDLSSYVFTITANPLVLDIRWKNVSAVDTFDTISTEELTNIIYLC